MDQGSCFPQGFWGRKSLTSHSPPVSLPSSRGALGSSCPVPSDRHSRNILSVPAQMQPLSPQVPQELCPHLNPPHSVLNGCRGGRHLLVHHGPKLLLSYIQALRLQVLKRLSQPCRLNLSKAQGKTYKRQQTRVARVVVCAGSALCTKAAACEHAHRLASLTERTDKSASPQPTLRPSAAHLTWPNCRMPCRGTRIRLG